MTLQTEEKPTLPPPATVSVDPNLADENLDSKEGWRIAREAFLREFIRYGGQAAIVISLLAVIGYAGYWSLGEMKSLPAFLQAISKPFMPPAPPAVTVPDHAQAKNTEKEHAKVPVHHHHHIAVHHAPTKVKPHQPAIHGGDSPTGGRIIFSDGYNTQYSWDK